VQLAVAVAHEFVGGFVAERFEARVHVVQLHAGHAADERVEELRGQPLGEPVCAKHLTRGDRLVADTGLLDHAQHVGGVVLQIGVYDRDDPAAGVGDAVCESAGLTRVLAVPKPADSGVLGGKRADRVPSPITGSVVDEDELVVQAGRPHHGGDLFVAAGDVLDLVVGWQNDGHVDGVLGRAES